MTSKKTPSKLLLPAERHPRVTDGSEIRAFTTNEFAIRPTCDDCSWSWSEPIRRFRLKFINRICSQHGHPQTSSHVARSMIDWP